MEGVIAGTCPKPLRFGGLKIKKKFIDYILEGIKTWEIRKSFAKYSRKYMKIPLLLLPACDKKTKGCNSRIVLGVVRIVDFVRVSYEDALMLVKTNDEKEFLMKNYSTLNYLYALRFSNPLRFTEPLRLPDPIRARKFVCNFSERNKEIIEKELRKIDYL